MQALFARFYNATTMRMRRVNWTITERQHRELKRLSRETGLPISELVRRALDKYLGLVGEESPTRAEAPAQGAEEAEAEEARIPSS